MHMEKLIELVRRISFLYDPEDKKYNDSDRREAAWREIGKVLNEPAKKCKRQWCCLRDSYRRCLKKRRDAKGGEVFKKWKYEDEMIFLMPYLRRRKNIPSAHADDESNDEMNADNMHFKQDTNSASTELAKYILGEKAENLESQCTDAVELFFKSIASTVNQFSPYNQAIAKARVFSIISDIELQELSCKHHSQATQNPSYVSMPTPTSTQQPNEVKY